VLVTAAVYWPVLHFDFVNYDDSVYVIDNPVVRSGLSWRGLVWAFTTNAAANWHPVTWLSLMLDYQWFGPNPGAFHAVNVALHGVNVLLLFGVLRRMTGALWRSALVAALFALHPLHVESVAWIAERKDVLSALFFLLCIGFYSRYTGSLPAGQGSQAQISSPDSASSTPSASASPDCQWRCQLRGKFAFYCLSLLCLALGLMAKPMLVSVPFVLLLLDFWPLQRWQAFPQPGSLVTRRSVAFLIGEKIPFFLLSLLSCVVTYRVQDVGEAVASVSGLPLSLRLGNALVSYARYLGKALNPVDLAVIYPHPDRWPPSQVAFAALLLLAITVAVLWFIRRVPFLALGWFWFLGMLVPVIGLVQVGSQSMADRYAYLPFIGLYLLLAWGAARLCDRWRFPRPAAGALSALVCLLLAVQTAGQVGAWQNSETLFRHAVAVTRNNYIAYNNLASWYLEQRQFPKALEASSSALWAILTNAPAVAASPEPLTLVTNPAQANVLYNVGAALASLGREREAIRYFQRTIQLKPTDWVAVNSLGQALLSLNQPEQALICFEAAARARPDYVAARLNYANVLSGFARWDDAIAQYRALLPLCPDNAEVPGRLGFALLQRGKPDEAVAQFRESVRLAPGLAQARNNLANVLSDLGRDEEALREYREGLRLEPASAQTHFNLALLLEKLGRRDEAVAHFKEALRLDPGNPLIRQHLDALQK
jgi:tetratricopeptide (TPR) repeat protein